MPDKLNATKAVLPKLTGAKFLASRLNALHTTTMPTPNTSIQSTITVTDINGNFVSTLSSCGVTVKFPDGSTQSLLLGSGVTNAGSGQYQASYNTKGAGVIVELWSLVAATGDVGSFQYDIGVGY